MSVKEIEEAIANLSVQDVRELMTWLTEHHARLWEIQISEDAKAGRLNKLLTEVDQEYQTELARPL